MGYVCSRFRYGLRLSRFLTITLTIASFISTTITITIATTNTVPITDTSTLTIATPKNLFCKKVFAKAFASFSGIYGGLQVRPTWTCDVGERSLQEFHRKLGPQA